LTAKGNEEEEVLMGKAEGNTTLVRPWCRWGTAYGTSFT
jgi:hypothetical protein